MQDVLQPMNAITINTYKMTVPNAFEKCRLMGCYAARLL
jgi:hypothetical protein